MNLSKLWEMVKGREHWRVLQSWDCKELDTTERLNSNNKLLGNKAP